MFTKEFVHQREDHNHLLKRVIASLREGNIPGFDLRFMRDALHDPSTGLTYESLTGKNKQSVPDCERIISLGVISFMEKNGHLNESRVLSILRNWHRAVGRKGHSSRDTVDVSSGYEGLAIGCRGTGKREITLQ